MRDTEMKNQRVLAMFSSFFAAAMLGGCATAESPPKFPDPQSTTLTGGTFVNVNNLRNVGPGLTKDQMVDLLGPPHFHEGIVAVHVWNYLFNFRRGSETVTCQYQVQFDSHMKVSGTYWRDPSCAGFLEPTALTASAPVEVETKPVEQFTLQSDTLFAFDKSSLDSMLPDGKAKLDKAIEQIKTHEGVSEITVVGYTDRIGSVAVNRSLSLARANTVRAYLIAHGLDRSLVHAQGVGSSQPISHCPDGSLREVINCLQPDRRVSIVVKG
ncbi:membrane protein [Caballeronia mineralivorans PML1(12)]|uniref:Membrane protein n=2 Tax=Caballeronia mineralivorans TaxID=2010198 RepID=A0A0J1FYT0_9BURK|nr:membrane protein [Caballeronia mineralivorans PML1(12)]